MELTRTRRSRRSRGMAMVEMVFVLPILLLLVFAIAEFGLMFSRWLTLSNAVREGARTGVVFRSPCNNATVETQVRTAVKSYAAAGGVALDDADITVAGQCTDEDPGNPALGKTTVSAVYPFPLRIPYASFDGTTIDLTYQSTMRNE